RHLSHGQRIDPAGIGELDRCVDDLIDAEPAAGPACTHLGVQMIAPQQTQHDVVGGRIESWRACFGTHACSLLRAVHTVSLDPIPYTVTSAAARMQEERNHERERAAVRARGLDKHYGELRALDELSRESPAGTTHGLLGPNGAGKSTVVKVLSTLVGLTRGTAEVAGFDVSRQTAQ